MGMVVKVSVIASNVTEAQRRISDAYCMTLPTFKRFLAREGYELSISEVRRK